MMDLAEHKLNQQQPFYHNSSFLSAESISNVYKMPLLMLNCSLKKVKNSQFQRLLKQNQQETSTFSNILKKLLLGLGSLLGGVLGGFVESSSLLNGGVRVELEHALDVLEWVLLDSRSLGGGSSGLESSLKRIIKNCCYCQKVNLDFISLEDSLEISVGEDWSWHGEALLVGRRVDGVKSLESFGGVDGESSNVATWGEL